MFAPGNIILCNVEGDNENGEKTCLSFREELWEKKERRKHRHGKEVGSKEKDPAGAE